MNNKLSFTFILTPLLNAHAEWVLILDEKTYSIATDGERLCMHLA